MGALRPMHRRVGTPSMGSINSLKLHNRRTAEGHFATPQGDKEWLSLYADTKTRYRPYMPCWFFTAPSPEPTTPNPLILSVSENEIDY